VIPWPFRNPPEFRGTEITILVGTTAKIPFRGIPGIARIPADSGRNTWRTVKNSSKYMIYVVKHIPCGFHVDSMDSTWNPCGIRGHGKVLLILVIRIFIKMRFINTVFNKVINNYLIHNGGLFIYSAYITPTHVLTPWCLKLFSV